MSRIVTIIGGKEVMSRYICNCCAVTEEELREHIEEFHITKVKQLVKEEFIGGFCNSCIKPIVQILKEER